MIFFNHLMFLLVQAKGPVVQHSVHSSQKLKSVGMIQTVQKKGYVMALQLSAQRLTPNQTLQTVIGIHKYALTG